MEWGTIDMIVTTFHHLVIPPSKWSMTFTSLTRRIFPKNSFSTLKFLTAKYHIKHLCWLHLLNSEVMSAVTTCKCKYFWMKKANNHITDVSLHRELKRNYDQKTSTFCTRMKIADYSNVRDAKSFAAIVFSRQGVLWTWRTIIGNK